MISSLESDMVDDLQRSLGKIEGSLEEILRRLDSYDKRITLLEQRVWKWSGVFATVLVFWTFISHKVAISLGLR